MCGRELKTEQNCNIFTPTLLAITAFLSRSPGLLNWGPGGPASLGHVPQSSIFSPTGLISKLNRGSRGPLLLGAVFSTAPFLQLPLNFLCTELYNSSTPTQSLPINGQQDMPLLLSLEWHVLIIIKWK